jgi:hypothetical protein
LEACPPVDDASTEAQKIFSAVSRRNPLKSLGYEQKKKENERKRKPMKAIRPFHRRFLTHP